MGQPCAFQAIGNSRAGARLDRAARLQHLGHQLPRRGFEELMAPFGEGDAVGLTRGADGRLQPTKSTLRLMRFNYTLKKGSFSDKLFQLQNFQQYAAPSARA